MSTDLEKILSFIEMALDCEFTSDDVQRKSGVTRKTADRWIALFAERDLIERSGHRRPFQRGGGLQAIRWRWKGPLLLAETQQEAEAR